MRDFSQYKRGHGPSGPMVNVLYVAAYMVAGE